MNSSARIRWIMVLAWGFRMTWIVGTAPLSSVQVREPLSPGTTSPHPPPLRPPLGRGPQPSMEQAGGAGH